MSERDRLPLTQDERRRLSAAIKSGNASSNSGPTDACPLDLLGCPAAGAHGLVYFNETIDEGDALDPDEARRTAAALLDLADHAEFGLGEWRRGRWVPDPNQYRLSARVQAGEPEA